MLLNRFFPRPQQEGQPSRAWAVGYAVAITAIVGALGAAAFAASPSPSSQSAQKPAVTSSPAAGRSNAAAGSQSPQATTSANSHTPTTVSIPGGASGLDVSRALAAAHVVTTSGDFYQLLLADPSATFYPGTYTLTTNLTPEAALAALNDPANRVQVKLVVPEGFTAAQIFARAAKLTNLPVTKFQQAAANPASLGVPKGPPNVEGWLFPATYTFEPGVDAATVLKAMVARTHQALDAAGLASASSARQQEVLTLASVIQKESGSAADAPKVSRVFLNRIAAKMPLQSDATVSYGAGGSTVVPTAAQYASKNGYNTYAHTGLPIGPISNPGDVSIAAALHPAAGKWLYFVTVNLQTGETVFSTTIAEHDAAVVQFRAWLKAHPTYAK